MRSRAVVRNRSQLFRNEHWPRTLLHRRKIRGAQVRHVQLVQHRLPLFSLNDLLKTRIGPHRIPVLFRFLSTCVREQKHKSIVPLRSARLRRPVTHHVQIVFGEASKSCRESALPSPAASPANSGRCAARTRARSPPSPHAPASGARSSAIRRKTKAAQERNSSIPTIGGRVSRSPWSSPLLFIAIHNAARPADPPASPAAQECSTPPAPPQSAPA